MHDAARGVLAGCGVQLCMKRHGVRWQVVGCHYAFSGTGCAGCGGDPLRIKRLGVR